MNRKSPLAAAVLNFAVAGVGYIYIGERVWMGALLMIGEILMIVGFVAAGVSLPPIASLGGLLFNLALAGGAWQDARRVNAMMSGGRFYEGEIVD